MHPDLLAALARQHHADLLDRHRAEPIPESLISIRPTLVRRAIRGIRHFVGVILVSTGQRLLQTTSTVADLSEARQ